MTARILPLSIIAAVGVVCGLQAQGPAPPQNVRVLSGATPGSMLAISPGQSIQSAVNAHPTGTAFLLQAGVHRLQRIVPKDGNSFVGEPGAVLSGARLLTAFGRSGNYWIATGQAQQGSAHGSCLPGYAACNYPEDLFIDDVPLRRVLTLGEVGAGTWYFDYGADTIYFGTDPTGRKVETSVTTAAFDGNASNVSIASLVVEKYASPAQSGAIHGNTSTAWLVQDCEIRHNHGVGLRIGPGMRVLRNHVHHNGQLGIGGVGDDVLVEGNEIAYNNVARYAYGWEAGGTKFVKTNRLVVRNNRSHHNIGPGLWTDIDNINTLYEGNTVEDNADAGIFHEISYAAVIRNNTIRRNGSPSQGWLWGAGIQIAASSNVEVYGNLVENNAAGIAGLQQNRGTGAYGAYQITNLWVHDNTVRMAVGRTGLAQDIGDTSYFTSRNNRFDANTYYLGSGTAYFEWMNGQLTETQWRNYGQDRNGRFIR